MATETLDRKDVRLAVRLTREQDELIRSAAAASGQTITDFVTRASVNRAEDTLADRRVFLLDDAAWEEFTSLMDRPAQFVPEFAELFSKPAVWEDAQAPAESAR